MKVIFMFLDGVGLGLDDPKTNPFAQVSMPNLQRLLNGEKIVANDSKEVLKVDAPFATLLAVDASMGIDGVPQSASGQAALLTGKNVPAWLGEHEGPKPTAPIVELITRGTIFTQLKQQARSARFLNAFPPRYFESIERGYRLPGVIALSAQQAGMRLNNKEDLFAGKAISADFSGEGWRSHLGFHETPIISLVEAGARINRLAELSDLSMFEYWLTDVAGHHQDFIAAQSILETLDTVIGSLVQSLDTDHTLILITSDHGNLEDLSTRHHTQNDVPLLLIGSQQLREIFLQGLNGSCKSKPDLTHIGPAIVRFIG